MLLSWEASCGETHFCSRCTPRNSVMEQLIGKGIAIKKKPVSKEFLVILSNTKKEETYECAERLRRGVTDLLVDFLKTPFTVSIGVAEHAPAMFLEGLISKTDPYSTGQEALGKQV